MCQLTNLLPSHFRYDNINSQPNFRGRGRGRGGHGRGGRGGGGGGNGQPRKPFREEPTLPPRNWELWCEACDMDFVSKDLLGKHKSEHTTCGVDGCKFTASGKMVQKHVTEQHESGLYDKLKNIDTPEDIVKWREERKRKYPTQANIELKNMAREARRDRGEKLEQSKAKFNNNQQQKKNNNNNNRKNKKRNTFDGEPRAPGFGQAPRPVKSSPVEAVEADEMCQGIRMFKGTRGMWEDEDEKKEEEEEKEDEKIKDDDTEMEIMPEEKPETSANPLLKLIGLYGGSDESEEEEDKHSDEKIEVTPPKCPVLDEVTEIIVPEDNQPQEAEEKQEQPPNGEQRPKHSKEKRKRHQQQQQQESASAMLQDGKRRKLLKSGLNYDSLRKTKPNTLLFKLLQDDIRHERNVLLQAVRFVVQNNFFDKEGEEKQETVENIVDS